jgi:glycopeptide antibiotics resistance protein
MRLFRKTILLLLFPILFGLAVYIPVGIVWREELSGWSDFWDIILGSLPNFIGAGLVVPFLVYLGLLIIGRGKIGYSRLLSVAISVGFFLTWELRQVAGSAFFDWKDIVATLLGGAVAFGLMRWLSRPKIL